MSRDEMWVKTQVTYSSVYLKPAFATDKSLWGS